VPTAYVLFPLSFLLFAGLREAAARLEAAGGRPIVAGAAKSFAEIALIFALVAGFFAAVSFAIPFFADRPDVTLNAVHRFDDFLQQCRTIGERLAITSGAFLAMLLILLPLGFVPAAPAGHPLFGRVRRLAFSFADVLRRYRKIHRRAALTLTFALSFTFLGGVTAGEIEQVTAARLDHAGKQLAEIAETYQQALAPVLARTIVERAVETMPRDYVSALKEFPDGARYLQEHIAQVERDYRISLTSLQEKIAPLVGRFPAAGPLAPIDAPSPEDSSSRLLAACVASGDPVTFADLDRVSQQLKQYKAQGEPATDPRSAAAEVPREIVTHLAGELLAVRHLGPEGLRQATGALLDQYPWLEPLLGVVSASMAKLVADRPFDAGWRALARLFRRDADGGDAVAAAVVARAGELTQPIAADPDGIDDRGRKILAVVIGDGRAIADLSGELEAEWKRAYDTLAEVNRARIAAMRAQYPLPGPLPAELRERKIDPRVLLAQTSANVDPADLAIVAHDARIRVDEILTRIESARVPPPDKRGWLDGLEERLRIGDPLQQRAQIVELETSVPDPLAGADHGLDEISRAMRERGPRTGSGIIEDRIRGEIDRVRRGVRP
jgi:hypothetical protein